MFVNSLISSKEKIVSVILSYYQKTLKEHLFSLTSELIEKLLFLITYILLLKK